MPHVDDRLDNWFREYDPLVDAEFERMKAARLDAAQAGQVSRRVRPISNRQLLVVGCVGILLAIGLVVLAVGR